MSSSRLTNIPVLIRQKARTASGCGSTTTNKDGYACTDQMYAEKNEEMSGESLVKTCREGGRRWGDIQPTQRIPFCGSGPK
jgi:hypothetical protein